MAGVNFVTFTVARKPPAGAPLNSPGAVSPRRRGPRTESALDPRLRGGTGVITQVLCPREGGDPGPSPCSTPAFAGEQGVITQGSCPRERGDPGPSPDCTPR